MPSKRTVSIFSLYLRERVGVCPAEPPSPRPLPEGEGDRCRRRCRRRGRSASSPSTCGRGLGYVRPSHPHPALSRRERVTDAVGDAVEEDGQHLLPLPAGEGWGMSGRATLTPPSPGGRG